MPIQILSSDVINQIAAGEVVERPAHLVKELVENALDAGSTEVDVEVSEGGRYIRVKDNGLGIAATELALALQRHTTSKIRTANDLWDLHSYGFRGEALSAIHSVSDFTLTSRQKNDSLASQMTSAYGILSAVISVGGDIGTEIIIKNLFANLPARLKFLKSPSAELSQIRTAIKAMALIAPQVQWRLLVDGKLDLFYPKQADNSRCQQILGVSSIYRGTAQVGDYFVESFISNPHETSKTNKNIWLFVQDRWVQDRALNAAVMEGYRNTLMHHEYPFIVIKMMSPPEQVDVNIHPTKSQVKFANPSDAFRAVVHAIRNTVADSPWSQKDSVVLNTIKPDSPNQPQQQSFSSPEYQQTYFRSKAHLASATPQIPDLPTLTQVGQVRKEQLQSYIPKLNPAVTESLEVVEAELGYWQSLQYIGQAGLTYLVCQDQLGLVFIDQHAADERVRFERVYLALKEGGWVWQEQLIPLLIDFSPEYKEVLMANQSRLKRLGIEIEEMGPSTIGVTSTAQWVKTDRLADWLESLAKQLLDIGDSFEIESRFSDWAATQACHGAIRAGKALSYLEVQQLLADMDKFPQSEFCPHGRPVFVRYNFNELEKDFGRLVT